MNVQFSQRHLCRTLSFSHCVYTGMPLTLGRLHATSLIKERQLLFLFKTLCVRWLVHTGCECWFLWNSSETFPRQSCGTPGGRESPALSPVFTAASMVLDVYGSHTNHLALSVLTPRHGDWSYDQPFSRPFWEFLAFPVSFLETSLCFPLKSIIKGLPDPVSRRFSVFLPPFSFCANGRGSLTLTPPQEGKW